MIARLFASFAAWSQAFSIRVKIIGLAACAVALMGLWSLLLSQSQYRTSIGEELERRGVAIASDLATWAAELVVTGSRVTLHELLQETAANQADVRYIAVLDVRGWPLAHTFSGGYPSDLLQVPRPQPGEAYHVAWLDTGTERIREISVPVLGGAAGFVRVGMSEARLEQGIARSTRMLALAFLAAASLGIAAAYMLTRILTRPVLSLVEATRAVAAGNLAHRAPPGPPDEIGLLVRAFNDMVERLADSHRMREELLDRVMTAQEEERLRIARELHDETSQAITSLVMRLHALEGTDDLEAIRARTSELRAVANRTLADLHRLVLELRPRALDELGLVPAVRRYTADFSAKFGIPVDLQTVGPEEMRLPVRVEVCLYRIIQESLTNVARHARPSQVSVVLDLRPRQVAAVIEDNGAGFDPADALRRHGDAYALGLHGMRERATLAGGVLEIESAPGSGTAVFVKIPLPAGEGGVGGETGGERHVGEAAADAGG